MTYADRQAERDSTYAAAYRAWIASLSPEERTKLAAQGIATPDTSRHTSTRQGDALVLQLAAAPESPPDESTDSGSPLSSINVRSAATAAADILASFCARIRAHPNPLLAFDAACFASGLMDIEGLSETQLAKRHRVTRAAFSKLVVQWAETFGLPPSSGMRSKKARRAYRRARLTSLAQHEQAAA